MIMIETVKTVWNGIAIDISYDPDYSNAFREIYGRTLAHLEIRAEDRQKLPMTETGFRSHFIHASAIEGYGGAEKFILDWLEHEAKSKEWKDYFDRSKQLTLF